jgi:type IV secretion system protein VirD4
MLGTYTFKAKGKSRQVGGKNSGGHSESESDQKRPLLLPQELKVIGKRKQIISLEDTKPILCERAFFFDDHRFIDRFKSVCPTLAALDQTPIRRVLRKLGFAAKVKPSHRFFQDTWERGELSSDVPMIDLDLHEARVQQRMRPLTVDDVAQGVDLRALALDTSKLVFPEGDGVDPEQVEAFVNSFFNALEAVNDEDEATPAIDADGASEPLSAEMLAELEAVVDGVIASAESNGAATARAPAGGLVDGDIDLAALLDAIQPADDAVLASAEPENVDLESTDRATSILDLSVLDRPTDQPNNKPKH